MDYIAHHGITGQKWGQRNGPPYPLKPSAHSAAEKRASYGGSSEKSYGGLLKARPAEDRDDTTYTIPSKTDLSSCGFRHKKGDTSLEADSRAVNAKNYYLSGDGSYMSNCTHCSMTYALRRMGLDAQAEPVYSSGRPLEDLNKYFSHSMDPSNIKTSKVVPGRDTANDVKKAVAGKCLDLCKNDKVGVGAVMIRSKYFGHMFSWEKTPSGKVVFLDAQSNHVDDRVIDRYFEYVAKGKRKFEPNVQVARFDNRDINTQALREIAHNRR